MLAVGRVADVQPRPVLRRRRARCAFRGWTQCRLDTNAGRRPPRQTHGQGARLNPTLDDPDQIFYALTARLVFRTWWNSHESVSLQYNKWIYGDEVPINFRAPPSEKLDTDALSLGFGMWW